MDETTLLSYAIGIWAFGAVTLAAVVVEQRWRWGLSATIGMVGGILIDVQSGQEAWLVFLKHVGIGAVGGLAACLLVMVLSWLLDRTKKYKGVVRSARLDLNPRFWPQSARREDDPVLVETRRTTPLNQQDIARRWFVTIAASVGAVVLSLMSSGAFWDAFTEAIKPASLVSAALVVVVAVVLIGPIQDFVLARSLGEQGESKPDLAEALTRVSARRSLLRLLLVFGLALTFIEVVNNSLDESFRTTHSDATLTVILSSLGPAIVTYYWCAALQLGVPRKEVGPLAMSSTVISLAIVLYLPGVATAVQIGLYGMSSSGGDAKAVLFILASPILGAFIAGIIGYMTAGVYAQFGGMALERFTGRKALAWLLVALLAAATVNQFGSSVVLLFMTESFDWSNYPYLLVGTVGWWLGLLAAGFPKIVVAYDRDDPAGSGPDGVPAGN